MSDERGIERPKPTLVQPPDGHAGSGFFATKVDEAIGLARKNSLWPLPFATSCCGIEFMATAFTLLPVTIIATGTPAGVGFVMDPPRCLDPGMRVRIEIDGIGTIDNPVIAQAS